MEWFRTTGFAARVLAELTRTYVLDLSAYPRWLVILAGTLLAALALWIGMKLLKWTLGLLLICVLIGGVVWAGWELLH